MTNQNNQISIIIPVYNEIKNIKKCLNSILEQTEKCPVIIVDNNSKDGSYKFLKDFIDQKQNKKQFKLLKCEQPGVSHTRNFGLENCKTEYCFFLDADELLPSNFIENLLQIIRKKQDVVYFKIKPKAFTFLAKLEKARTPEEKVARLWRTAVWKKLGGQNPSLKVSEDIDVRNRAKEQDYKISHSNLVFYHIIPETFKEMVSQCTWCGQGLRNFTRNTFFIRNYYLLINLIFLTPILFLFFLFINPRAYLYSLFPFFLIQAIKLLKNLMLHKNPYCFFIPFYEPLKAFLIILGFITKRRFE